MSGQASLGAMAHPVTLLPQPGIPAVLIPATILSVAFQNAISTVVSIEQARNVTLLVKFTPIATSAAVIANILVAFSYERTAPATTADSWFVPTTQIAGSQIPLPGTVPTSAAYAAASDWQPIDCVRSYYRLEPSDEAEPSREAITIPEEHCKGARWMYVAAAQSGDTDAGDFGTIAIDYVLHV